MKKERVLLTGATGFLGYNIARILSQRGFEITVSVRSRNDVTFLEELGCFIKCGSLNDLVFIEQVVERQDYVIHCASMTEQSNPDFEAYNKANVLSTELLVQASKKFRIKRFILVSTANCFTSGTFEAPGNESSGFMDFLKDSNYAYSKFRAHEFVLNETKESGFPAVVVAPTFMIGPHDRKPSSGKLLLYVLKNRFVFYPSKGGKNFVNVVSVAEATISALTKGKLGESYLLAGINTSYKEYFTEIQKASGLRQTKYFIAVPGVFIQSVIRFLKIMPTKNNKMLVANLKLFFAENYFANDKATQGLDIPATNLEKSISDSIEWFKQAKYITQ